MISYIDPRYLDAVWPKVEGLLSDAIKKANGEVTIEQLRLLVLRGDSHLVVWHENDEVVSAGTVEFINYPNYRVAYCSFLSGKYTEESFEALKAWCRDLGATKIQCWGDDAVARLYARYGMEKKYNLLRLDL